MRDLTRKIARLEDRMSMVVVPPEDRTQVFDGHRWQRKTEAERRRTELLRRYGPEGLEQITFIHLRCFYDQCFPDDEEIDYGV